MPSAAVTFELTLPSGAVKKGRPEDVFPSLLKLLATRAERAEFRDPVARDMGMLFARQLRGVLQGGHVGVGVGGAALSPLTVSTKGHGAKLFHAGRLSSWHMVRPGSTGEAFFYFRGRAASSVGTRGEAPMLEQVAAAQEYGVRVRVTAQMVKFFRAAALKDGWHRGFLRFREGDEIRIPARPFFKRTLSSLRGEVQSMILHRIVEDWNQVR